MGALGEFNEYLVRLPVFVNGVPLEEVTQVDVTFDSGRTEIYTQTKGLAGWAEGAKLVTVRVTSAIPVGGPEVNTWNLCNSGEITTLQVGVGAGDYAQAGKIINTNMSGSVNNATEHVFEWHGLADDIS
jgi:hypothetical protein